MSIDIRYLVLGTCIHPLFQCSAKEDLAQAMVDLKAMSFVTSTKIEVGRAAKIQVNSLAVFWLGIQAGGEGEDKSNC